MAFVYETEIRAQAQTFHLMFGRANEPRYSPVPQIPDIIGLRDHALATPYAGGINAVAEHRDRAV